MSVSQRRHRPILFYNAQYAQDGKQFTASCGWRGVRRSGESTLVIEVEGEGQHHCLNLLPAGDHESSKIFFECHKIGSHSNLFQRCRCDSYPGKTLKGPCKTFCSTPKSLTRADTILLFS